ncbi:class I SAM-dependent methyltransferase [Fulvivirga lutea]|uniref:Class I SAM-dependent methyltransferase n=1 Tax=Fulvivirga lutea TaxID=2810512 RepID=A0A974WHR1_9BACT|nr:class I SAM-dependent methyltransferase [Fulvivirga lutea]QSE98355.1 class I SAM-dependent methyltransferase [Fulvivirga lutea]
MNNFNRVSFFYDWLAKLVFGRSILNSQTAFFSYLKEGDEILICGGGTGQILKELEKLNIKLRIDYVEKSKKMIDRAKEMAPLNKLDIQFIQKDIFDVQLKKYQIVITPFFLDVFKEENLIKLIDKLSSSLQTTGFWLCTDFKRTNQRWKDIFIQFMYWFFRLTTNLEGNLLLDFESSIVKSGCKKLRSATYFHEMIEAGLYQKL